MARPKCKKADKDRFPTELDCNLAIAAIQGKNRRHRHRKYREEPCRSYECEFCGGWHMTSQPERQSLTR